ncbi:uncharacterized protein BDV17DRAFT_20221 [Aspergillus undulatus]|uniref:uncharacterized protein n=1 Tax=Aspergillus undulatus TaxID=1810928 RepID=UPI003CCD7F54
MTSNSQTTSTGTPTTQRRDRLISMTLKPQKKRPSTPKMNWTGGRLRRHSEHNFKAKHKPRKRTFRSKDKDCGPHQITLFNDLQGGGGTGRANDSTAGPGLDPGLENLKYTQTV